MDLAPDLQLADFKLPPPKNLSKDDRSSLVRGSFARIWEGAKDLAPSDLSSEVAMDAPVTSAADMWMLLIVRLVTRVTDPAPHEAGEDASGKKEETSMEIVSDIYSHQDRLRQTLCDYIMADFPGRYVDVHRPDLHCY